MDYVQSEIVSSGLHKSLIGGIVMTGGGAQLRHMKQFVEYHTGMHCRIGSPNYHVSSSKDETKLTPILSTGVGLLMTYENKQEQVNSYQSPVAEVVEEVKQETVVIPMVEEVEAPKEEVVARETEQKKKKGSSILDSLDWLRRKFEDQFKENLD